MLKLVEIADANASALITRYEACHRAKPPAEASQLERFAEHVQKTGQVSVNMRPFVLSNLLADEPHRNMYEWAQDQADLSGRRVTDILREKLGTYHDQRLAFDISFENGKKFRYGALNTGGIGTSNYGQFCVVLKADFPASTPTFVYLQGDSLKTCMNPGGTLNETAVRTGCSRHDQGHLLAAIKHSDDIPRTAEDTWPAVLCSNKDYIEAIFERPLSADDIDKVRVTDADYQNLFNLAFADFTRKLSPAEAAEANDFVQILRAQRDRPVSMERL
jgi:hypothetical protein